MLRLGDAGVGAWAWVLVTSVNLVACAGGVEPESSRDEAQGGGGREDSDNATETTEPTAVDTSDEGSVDSTQVDDADAATNVPVETTGLADGGSAESDDTGTPVVDAVDGPVAVRLTQVELSHVLRDVLGDTSEAARAFVAEDEYTPFDNDAQRQTVSASLIDSIGVLADDVASRMAYDSVARASWMPCEPENQADAACFDMLVATLGERFLRRELSAQEIERYRGLLDFAYERQDFYAAVELLLSALIQDPEFLYRLERGSAGDPNTLTAHEVATRMAFLLLGSTPDDALLARARDGELNDGEVRRAEAERLLDDPRARTQLNRFHAMWLGYRAIPHDATLNAAFQLETERLIERVVFDEPQSYLQLFESNETYVNALLAEHYGLDVPEGYEGWIAYPSDSGRAGILSHGSVLSAFSKFSDTSPTQRGIFVRNRLLCLAVPSAPPSVDVDQPPGGEAAEGACKVERYRAHREQSGCVDCHNLFEPIGMGLEQFDRAGRFRGHDDDNEACAIDGVGEVPGLGMFSGPQQLAQLLVDNDAIQACMVRHYLQYALARAELSATELGWVQAETATFNDGGLRLRDFIVALVSQEQFASREVNP